MIWAQQEIRLPSFSQGCHPITRYIVEGVPELADVRIGLMHVFLQHTSASLTVNENADPDVPVDLDSAMNSIAPENFPYRHTLEGPDDMPAHVKTSLLGCSLTIPISNGRLAMGTWQGIFLFEHRRRAGSRKVMVTVQGVE